MRLGFPITAEPLKKGKKSAGKMGLERFTASLNTIFGQKANVFIFLVFCLLYKI